ncbi:DNA-directed RNA polymerases I and III subunit RPAC1 isoform X2 [Procambarus clarkii]|uniref:DNA-directed RNA polymerases I and III subunit RPAC1 isoform X2 n=1 Tax=Procambarus clarkii TaxID=6728 RepID=UPI001E671F96|nr:DNA-directed RNA polymerases I and III subunit RPAC1-like isoform X2 [Procambarus clarkii]
MESARITMQEFQLVYENDSPNLSTKRKKNKGKTGPVGGKVEIIKMNSLEMEIDFIGFHISLVNAIRRIILAEVPTMAIEKVYMYNNTSIVQDEVLAHRLGLVPLKVDPRYFEFRNKVLSSSLKWVPLGNQGFFKEAKMQPLHQDILLAKMNAGHVIELEAYAVKGIGSDHAKFQPGLAWYRLLPEIELTREVEGEQAELLQKCFSPGVIDVVTTPGGKKIAKVNDARNDSCSRNVFEYDSIKDAVKLTRKPEHVIFYVESHSALKSYEILEESVNIMIGKCSLLLAELDNLEGDTAS